MGGDTAVACTQEVKAAWESQQVEEATGCGVDVTKAAL
jgi:hypothetical protein